MSLRFVGYAARSLSVMPERCYAVIGSNILFMMDELQRLCNQLDKSDDTGPDQKIRATEKLFNTFANWFGSVILADVFLLSERLFIKVSINCVSTKCFCFNSTHPMAWLSSGVNATQIVAENELKKNYKNDTTGQAAGV